MHWKTFLALLNWMCVVGMVSAAGPLSLDDDLKPRFVVMTDIGGDPDDRQSMVRFLLYSCDLKVEGLLTGFGWGHNARLTLKSVPQGTYAVYAYVWEETGPTAFTIALEGEDVRRYQSGSPGEWRRLGPWIVDIEDGDIHITSRDGDANFSGLEVWRRTP
ncbi:MAG: nucleoside hydrolase-like domain-containing protein [Planctomycetota bacterium]